jgi:hypothetical protein
MAIDALWKSYLAGKAKGGSAYDADAYDEQRRAAYRRMFGATPQMVHLEPLPTPPFPMVARGRSRSWPFIDALHPVCVGYGP